MTENIKPKNLFIVNFSLGRINPLSFFKILKKADKWLEKFDVKKFMKKNPTLTSSDFYMVMFMETESITK